MADLLRMLTCSVHPLPYLANPADYFAALRHAPGAVLLDKNNVGLSNVDNTSRQQGIVDILSKSDITLFKYTYRLG